MGIDGAHRQELLFQITRVIEQVRNRDLFSIRPCDEKVAIFYFCDLFDFHRAYIDIKIVLYVKVHPRIADLQRIAFHKGLLVVNNADHHISKHKQENRYADRPGTNWVVK